MFTWWEGLNSLKNGNLEKRKIYKSWLKFIKNGNKKNLSNKKNKEKKPNLNKVNKMVRKKQKNKKRYTISKFT